MMIVLDELKRTEKTLLCISHAIPMIRKSILDFDGSESELDDSDYLWVLDDKTFNLDNGFTNYQIYNLSCSRWFIYRTKPDNYL